MTGSHSIQQRARVAAHVAASFSPFTGFDPMDGVEPHMELARDNPCHRHPDCDCVVECAAAASQCVIAPAEDLQADPDLDPGITPRLGVGLAAFVAFVAVAITAHLCWLSMGMPTLAQIPSAIMETLNV